jgi:hypothetical protein
MLSAESSAFGGTDRPACDLVVGAGPNPAPPAERSGGHRVSELQSVGRH